MSEFFDAEYENSLEITSYDLALKILQEEGSIWEEAESHRYLLFNNDCYCWKIDYNMFSALFRDGNIEEDEVEISGGILVFIYPTLIKAMPECMKDNGSL